MLNPFISSQKLVLGIESIATAIPTKSYLNYLVSRPITPLIPLLTPTPSVIKETNKKTVSKKSPAPTPTLLPENTPLHVLQNKQNIIANYVLNKETIDEGESVLLSTIFEDQLVETFGDSLNKVFNDFVSIEFTNSKIISSTEATSSALIQTKLEYKTYKCFFVYKNNDWFLYKTEDL